MHAMGPGGENAVAHANSSQVVDQGNIASKSPAQSLHFRERQVPTVFEEVRRMSEVCSQAGIWEPNALLLQKFPTPK